MHTFIDSKVRKLARKKDYGQELRMFVEDYLRTHADDTFLWVALVCKELIATSLRKTRWTLAEFLSGLEPLYDRMMAQIDSFEGEEEPEYCKRSLRAATLTLRPLQTEELAFVAELPRDEFKDLRFLQELVRQCGSFLTLRKEVVYFAH